MLFSSVLFSLFLVCKPLQGVHGVTVTVNPSSATVATGSSYSFSCTYVTSLPDEPPDVTWTFIQGDGSAYKTMYQLDGFNNREIFGPGYETRVTFVGDISNQDVSLQLTGMTANDIGTYRCFVSVFGDGDGQDTTDVTVMDPPGDPTLSLSPNPACENVIQNVQLTCRVTSGTTPFTYTFHRGSTQLASGSSNSLTLYGVDRTQAGTYSCTVSNVLGADFAQTTAGQILVVHYLGTPQLTLSSPVSIAEGNGLSVVCSVPSSPASPTLQWSKGGTNEPAGATLRKNPVSRSDAGTYTCTAINTCGIGSASTSAQLVVDVQYLPAGNPACAVTSQANIVTLTCEWQGGNPAVDLVWTYGDNQQAGASQTSQNQVAAPVTADGTTYTCTATSPVHGTTRTCVVTLAAPSVTVPPQPTSTSLLGTVSHTLTCTVDSPGVPAASALTWTGPAVTAGRTTGGTLATPSLTISGVEKSDAGDYTCTAENLIGYGSDSLSLAIHYPPELIVTATPNPVNETKSVSLTCTADSNPDVTSMAWMFVETGQTLIYQTTGNSLTYISSPVSHESAGVYRCTSDNGVVGSPVSRDITLTVNFVPIFNHTRDLYVIGTSQPVTLECSAFAYPPQIVYTWIKGGHDMTGNATSQDGVSTLYIPSVQREHYGDYTCTAWNGQGNRATTIQLVDETQPEPSTNLDYTKKTAAGNVTLTWTAEFNGGLETTHTVQYRLEATIDWVSGPSVVEEATQERPEFTRTVELPEKGQYEIRIRAENGKGAVESNVIAVLVEENQILYGTLAIICVEYTDGVCEGELSNRILAQLGSTFDIYKGYEGAVVTKCRSGSVLADFEATVAQSESAAAQTTFTENLSDGQLGEFTVDPDNSRISDTKPTVSNGASVSIIIIAVVVSAVVLIAVTVAAIFLMRRHTAQRKPSTNAPKDVELEDVSDQTYQDLMTRSENQKPDEAAYEDVKTSSEFPRSQLAIKEELGQGEFGSVHRAEAWNMIGQDGVTVVAVKAMKAVTSPAALSAFFKELSVLELLGTHPNVVSFLGCCTDIEPFYLLLEYVSGGSLQSNLRTSRTQQTYGNLHGGSKSLSSRDLTKFALDVAKGMNFLSSKKIIHRDLASRNVLVSADRTCKVSDFGFSREGDEYERTTTTRLPVRWMAPESLFHRKYTTKTDVWAFGVLLWEIVTLGATPYPGMSKREVMDGVQQGYRMDKPKHCDNKLYSLMLSCWEADPARRPEFRKIQSTLDLLMETEHNYINLASLDENTYTSLQTASDEKY